MIEFRDHGDLAGEFEDGAVSLAGIEAGVGGDAFDGECVVADAFAGRLGAAFEARGRFKDEHSDTRPRGLLRERARGRAADFKAPCQVLSASIANIISAMPDFMSSTPGPCRRPFAM